MIGIEVNLDEFTGRKTVSTSFISLEGFETAASLAEIDERCDRWISLLHEHSFNEKLSPPKPKLDFFNLEYAEQEKEKSSIRLKIYSAKKDQIRGNYPLWDNTFNLIADAERVVLPSVQNAFIIESDYEMKVFEVATELLTKLSAAHEIRFRIQGKKETREGKWSGMYIELFRMFSQYCFGSNGEQKIVAEIIAQPEIDFTPKKIVQQSPEKEFPVLTETLQLTETPEVIEAPQIIETEKPELPEELKEKAEAEKIKQSQVEVVLHEITEEPAVKEVTDVIEAPEIVESPQEIAVVKSEPIVEVKEEFESRPNEEEKKIELLNGRIKKHIRYGNFKKAIELYQRNFPNDSLNDDAKNYLAQLISGDKVRLHELEKYFKKEKRTGHLILLRVFSTVLATTIIFLPAKIFLQRSDHRYADQFTSSAVNDAFPTPAENDSMQAKFDLIKADSANAKILLQLIADSISKTSTTTLPSKGVAYAKVAMAYFYKEPDLSTRKDVYCVGGSLIKYNQVENEFVHGFFANTAGNVTTGWIKISDLDMSGKAVVKKKTFN